MTLPSALRAHLLAVGGTDVVLGHTPSVLYELLRRGKFFSGDGAATIPVRYSPDLYRAGARQMYGYALCDDGMWRQHTWCILDSEVIEFSSVHRLYFGYPISNPAPAQRQTALLTSALHVERVRRTLERGENFLDKRNQHGLPTD